MTNTFMKGYKLFVDSGAFIALTSPRDENHSRASKVLMNCRKSVIQVTTNLIISETYTFLRYKLNYNVSSSFLEKIKRAEKNGYLHIVYSTPELEQRGINIIKRYNDQDLSYVDAVSFALLEIDTEIQDIFTFDQHFYITGRSILPG